MSSYFNKKNLGWGFAEKVWRTLFDAFTLIIFAKILGPEILGQYALLLLLIGFSSVIVEAGSGDAVIREKENKKFESTIFWFNLTNSLIYILIVYSTSSIISDFLNYPDYSEKIIFLLPVIIFNSLLVVPTARLKREGAFHILSKRNIIAGLIAKLVGLMLAFYGHGIESLIVMAILGKISELLLVYSFSRWLPDFLLDIHALRKNRKFIFYLSATKFINYFSKRIGIIIMAQFFGPIAVGLYDLASKLMTYVLKIVNGVLLPILYSDIVSNPKDIDKRIVDITIVMSLFYYPIIAYIVINSNELFTKFFGPEWEAASVLMIILFLSLRILAQAGIASQVLKSLGHSNQIFNASVKSTIFLLIASYIGAYLNKIEYVAVAYLLYVIILMIFLYLYLKRHLKINYFSLINSDLKMLMVVLFSSTFAIIIRNNFLVSDNLLNFIIYSVLYAILCIFSIYFANREAFFKSINLFSLTR